MNVLTLIVKKKYFPAAVQILQKHLGPSAYGCRLNKVLEVVVALPAQWNWEVPCWKNGKHINEQQSLKKEDCSCVYRLIHISLGTIVVAITALIDFYAISCNYFTISSQLLLCMLFLCYDITPLKHVDYKA